MYLVLLKTERCNSFFFIIEVLYILHISSDKAKLPYGHIYIIFHWHYSPMRAFASIMDLLTPFRGHNSDFLTGSFLRGGVVNPTPILQPGGPGPIFITPGTGWLSYTPRHWYPFRINVYEHSVKMAM